MNEFYTKAVKELEDECLDLLFYAALIGQEDPEHFGSFRVFSFDGQVCSMRITDNLSVGVFFGGSAPRVFIGTPAGNLLPSTFLRAFGPKALKFVTGEVFDANMLLLERNPSPALTAIKTSLLEEIKEYQENFGKNENSATTLADVISAKPK